MKKLISLHSSLHKHSSLKLLFLLSLLSLFSIFALITTTENNPSRTTTLSRLPKPLINALIHYATTSNSSIRFSSPALKSISSVLNYRPLNFLVFGLSHETLLWKTLNFDGRTVFVDESTYLVTKLEEKHPEIEAYDVQFSPKPTKFQSLVKYAETHVKKACRPVQNLLYSECKLGITDLPNFVYEVAWDVILVDGPMTVPWRVAAIFTASVLARTRRRGAGGGTHVFVHDFDREVERVCSGEFLCSENLVEEKGRLGHFVLGNMGEGGLGFCRKRG